MDSIMFHPKVVHIPIALAALMPLLAAGLVLAWRQQWLPRRAWWIAALLQAVLVGSALLALQTGEAEEERVERVVAERYLEAHEEAAQAFVWSAGVTLAVMLAGAIVPAPGAGFVAAVVSTIASLVVLGLGYRTGQMGGALVYEHGAASAYVGVEAGQGSAFEGEREDDD